MGSKVHIRILDILALGCSALIHLDGQRHGGYFDEVKDLFYSVLCGRIFAP